MKTKCVLLRLKRLHSISNKAYIATDFNGNSDVLPKSQVFAVLDDCSIWASQWVIEKKNLTYSHKHAKIYDSDKDCLYNAPVYHEAPKLDASEVDNKIEELRR